MNGIMGIIQIMVGDHSKRECQGGEVNSHFIIINSHHNHNISHKDEVGVKVVNVVVECRISCSSRIWGKASKANTIIIMSSSLKD